MTGLTKLTMIYPGKRIPVWRGFGHLFRKGEEDSRGGGRVEGGKGVSVETVLVSKGAEENARDRRKSIRRGFYSSLSRLSLRASSPLCKIDYNNKNGVRGI